MVDTKETQSKQSALSEDRKATEFLANERTFLAWIRTSVSIVSLGFVIAKFRVWMQEIGNYRGVAQQSSHENSWIIGIAMMVLGALLAVLAAWRYHIVNLQIERGKVSADRGLIILVTVLVVLFAAAMIATILVTMKN